jgi:hypothetical protein
MPFGRIWMAVQARTAATGTDSVTAMLDAQRTLQDTRSTFGRSRATFTSE